MPVIATPLLEDWPAALRLILFGAIVAAVAIGLAGSIVMLRLAKWRKQGETLSDHKRAVWGDNKKVS